MMTELRSEIIEKMTSNEQMNAWKEQIAKIDEQFNGRDDMPICCICKGHLNNPYGNNPQPVRKRGKCCDKCNYDKVLPARMGGLMDLGSWEEHILQQKVMAIASYPALLECWNEDDHFPSVQKVIDDYTKKVLSRGMMPQITLTKDKRSISFVDAYDFFKSKKMSVRAIPKQTGCLL